MDVCKWCSEGKAEAIFENAKLCSKCHPKAIWASKNPSLCAKCNSLFTDDDVTRQLLSEDGYSHWDITSLRISSEEGCSLCRIFLLQDQNVDWARLSSSLVLFAEKRDTGAVSPKDVQSLYFWSMTDQFKLTVSVSAAVEDPASKEISQRPPETNLANHRTFKQAKSWIQECTSTHSESINPSSVPRLPTRVLDVGQEGDDTVKIFEPTSITHEPYITLSYCWGKERFLTSTLANIDSHRNSLDLAKLPETIRDAVIATRGLGFRYVWIDALCIIQDSPDDKIKEIGGMGDIYHNSALTIAAVSASAVAEGFLNPKPKLTATLPYRCVNGVIGEVQLSLQRMVDLWQETMYTRGWCLQEYLLSGRLLLFTDTEVIWSCQTDPFRRPDTTHVTYNYESAEISTSPFRRLPGEIFMNKNTTTSSEEAPFNLADFKEWTSLVANYSRRQLTVLSDRLPALSGVAEKYQAAWGGDYYAGLWAKHFIQLLSWRRNTRLQKEPYTPLPYRAPSWSWASVEGALEFQFQNGLAITEPKSRGSKAPPANIPVGKGSNAEIPGAKMISCIVEPVSKEFTPLGEVLSGRVILEGQMIPTSASPASKDVSSRGTIYWDYLPLNSDLEGDMELQCQSLLLGEAWAGGPKSEAVALLLMPVEGESEVFKRVGLHVFLGKGAAKAWGGVPKKRRVTVV